MEVLCVAVWSCFTDQDYSVWWVFYGLQPSSCSGAKRSPLPKYSGGFQRETYVIEANKSEAPRQKICSLEDNWSPKNLLRFRRAAFWAQLPTLWIKVDPKWRWVKVKAWTRVYGGFEQSCRFWASIRTLLLCSCWDLQVSPLQSYCLRQQSLPNSLYSEAWPAPVMFKYLEIFGAILMSAICKVKSHQFHCSSFKKFWWL